MKLPALILFLFFSIATYAEPDVSNAELSRKLDLVLNKIGGLERRVSELESSDTSKGSISSTGNLSVSSRQIIPEDPQKEKGFFRNLSNKLRSEQDKASGPWAMEEPWKSVRKNLTRFQVRELLGNPHEVRTSLDPRIDQVYCYEGDLDADGKDDKGRVSFFRDRVVSFQTPFEK